jgi:hypothetical protein
MMEDISNSNSDANMSAAPPPPPPQQQQTGDFDIMKMLFGI